MEFDLPTVPHANQDLPGNLELGAFSVSLNVDDLAASRTFYEKLGFVVSGGSEEQDYLILKNGETTIGIFVGMFEGSILTFNPGLTNKMERIEEFTDIREIEAHLSDAGLELDSGVEEDSREGPAAVSLRDPDGNQIDAFTGATEPELF